MLDFFKKLLDGFKKQERFTCVACYKLIMAHTKPEICPHCKAPNSKIIKTAPKVHALQKPKS